MQRSRGIGADVFDLDVVFGMRRQIAEVVALCQNRAQYVGDRVLLEKQIDETGAGDFRTLNQRRIQLVDNRAGDLRRSAPSDPGRLHGEIGRKIAELFLRRLFQLRLGICSVRERAFVLGTGERRRERLCQFYP